MTRIALTVAVFLSVLAPVAHAGETRHGVGVGLDLGSVEFDLPGDPTLDFAGFNVFGKIGVTDRWGIFVNYRDMEDDENLAFGEKDS